MTMSPRTWIAATVMIAVASASPIARADNKNEVRAVTFDEDSGITRVHVRGAQTPTFTVYKLERPSRVVIDLPQAKLADALRGHESAAVFTPSTWAVSTIAAQQLDDGAVRVIVTLARPGRYDVKTDGNDVTVFVMPRDPAPKTASAADLAAAQAEADRLRAVAAEQAARAEHAVDEAKKLQQQSSANAADVARAKAEAQKASADAEAARKAAVAQAERAKAETAVAQQEAQRAKQDAAAKSLEIDQAKKDVAAKAAEADQARRDAAAKAAEAERARRDAAAKLAEIEQAKKDAAAKLAEIEQAKKDAAAGRAEAEQAKKDLAAKLAQIDQAKKDAAAKAAQADQAVEQARRESAAKISEAEQAKRESAAKLAQAEQETRESAAKLAQAEQAKKDAAAKLAEAEQVKREAAAKLAEADAARRDAASGQAQLAAARRDAETKRAEAEAAKREAAARRAEAEQAKKDAADKLAEADQAKQVAAARLAEVTQAKADAAAARNDAAQAKTEAARAKADADVARLAAAADKKQAESDRASAETARSQAEKMMKDAKAQLAAIDKKAAAAQDLEDRARAAHAQAEAREEAARDSEATAIRQREAAQLAAKRAQDARDRAAASDRAKLVADARAAEEQLAAAKKATDEAEARRVAAEQAAKQAKTELEQSRTALAGVEQQRVTIETAATEAARKRSEAEAAASDAARRRGEAEVAATEATKKRAEAERAANEASKRRGEAEQQRLAAEQAKREADEQRVAAEQAAKSADKQRAIAEASAKTALAAKQNAEASLAQLDAKRAAAEHAAAELETKMKAEAKAQAELAAAKARQASDEELAAARTEATKLADQRKHAESELADRRKAVASQQAEVARLETAAAQAKDSADREEARRAKLAQQREAEETQLAVLRAQKSELDQPAAVAVSGPKSEVRSPKSSAPKARVKSVNFRGGEGSAQVALAIDGDADVHLGEVTTTTVEVIVDHADLAPKLERTLDVSRFGTPIKRVSSFHDRRTPDRVRLIAELASPVTPKLERDASGAKLVFIDAKDIAHAPRVANVPSPVMGGFGATSTPVAQQSVTQVPPPPPARGNPRQRIYHGATVDFDFKDAPIHDLLRILADTGHVNIVVPDTIDAKVTVRLKRVPWDQALDVILASHDLGYRREGNLYRIAPRKQLDQEDEAEAARREAMVKAESPKPEVVTLNYSSAGELKSKLDGMLSPKGKLEVDERTNSLIINDVAGNREQIARLALQLDTQTPQITIEARIVEANSDYVRQFGIQWGGNALAGAAGGNATGLVWPSSVGVRGGNEDQNTNARGVQLPSDFAINMPAATGTGEGGALGISLGSVGGNFNINLRLSALEDVGTVRIISAPKITVLNNKEAYIKQGVSIPISVVSAAGTQTQFVQADLQLKVTPYVSQRDCAIAMTLDVTKNEPDFVNVGARGDPTIVRKEAHTVMLVNDGETTVVGGIYTRNSGLAYKKVPFFGDLPFVGWLFKNRRENDNRTEVLVFITPKITNKASLRCVQ